MMSHVAFEEKMAVRIKEEEAYYINCTAGHQEGNLWRSFESNSKRARQHSRHGEKTAQGNHQPLPHIEASPVISVKQERVKGMCHSSGCNSTPPLASRKNSAKGHEMTAYEFSDKTQLENIKAEDFIHASRPESKPHPDSPTRLENMATSFSISRASESVFFPWQTREQVRDSPFEEIKNPPSPRTSYLCFPGKQVFSRFQAASNFAANVPGMQRCFRTEMKVDSARNDQQRAVQQEPNFGLSSIYDNEDENRSGPTQVNLGPRPLEQSLSPRDRAEHTSSSEKNGFTHLREKTADSSYQNKKDEEPVWKKYQWYRDRKRPYSLQIKRPKTEQPIFMQYNEIRDKRFKEGRVVTDKRRLSEPWNFPGEDKRVSPSLSPLNTASHLVTAHNDAIEQSSKPVKRRKISHDSVLSEDRRNFIENADIADDVFPKGRGVPHYSRDDACLNAVDENCNYDKTNAARDTLRSPDAKSKNGFETTVTNDNTESPHNTKELSSTVFEEKVDVRPGTLRHHPQDVAKILRLNRIVKAVRNNTMGRKEAEKMKQSEVTSSLCDSHDRYQGRSQLAHQQGTRMESPCDANPDGNNRGCEQQTTGKIDERRSPNDACNDFCHPEDEKRFVIHGHKEPEGNSDFSGTTQPYSDQITTHQMNVQDDDEPVCQVNGLLSLPGLKETKFSISLGELKRRMKPPETLTRVEMISYVRQAKSAGRILLDRNNIVTANRSHPTILSRVCESEAQVLADGILKMNKEYLPMAFLARKTVDAYKDDGCRVDNCEDCRLKLRRRIVDVEITRNSLKELHKAMEETKKEDAFETFELASHTFGVANILNHLTLLDEYFRVLLLTLQDE